MADAETVKAAAAERGARVWFKTEPWSTVGVKWRIVSMTGRMPSGEFFSSMLSGSGDDLEAKAFAQFNALVQNIPTGGAGSAHTERGLLNVRSR